MDRKRNLVARGTSWWSGPQGKELDPHSILVKHHIRPSVARLSAIAESWDPFDLDPIFITCDGNILKELEECQFAGMKNIEKVFCLEQDPAIHTCDRFASFHI